jgi:hypothetical protein
MGGAGAAGTRTKFSSTEQTPIPIPSEKDAHDGKSRPRRYIIKSGRSIDGNTE